MEIICSTPKWICDVKKQHSVVPCFLSLFLRFSYSKSRVQKREANRDVFFFWFTLQMAVMEGLGLAKAKNLELHLDLPLGWQGAKHLGHLLLLDGKWRSWDSTSTRIWDVGAAGNSLPLYHTMPARPLSFFLCGQNLDDRYCENLFSDTHKRSMIASMYSSITSRYLDNQT